MMRWAWILFIVMTMALWSVPAPAVEVAPRITDREIIESLAMLKQGQADINRRFDDINRRFDDINRRFDGLQNTILVLFGAIIALIVALFGYIAWDRRTALRPLQDRLERLERDLYRDLDLQHEDGSRLTRLIKVLREMAKTDKNIAELLRSFSLL